ncbi:hypothetical protein BTO05_11025 [Winogradskyella sp. PC-19]|uniref:hypothetical protein n=1 Tax=Winogradskyella sp. PC-19 TaxID=754417 RepID=UPI000B3CE843|nr:hypothetical protein [Winogradskyella sp. PC-19]ARV10143.1 hypothetical protein BTO05_11025 [Winogradskyella sp. PC-19]
MIKSNLKKILLTLSVFIFMLASSNLKLNAQTPGMTCPVKAHKEWSWQVLQVVVVCNGSGEIICYIPCRPAITDAP